MILKSGLRGEGRIGGGRAIGWASDEARIVGDLNVSSRFDFGKGGESGFKAR